MDEKKRAQENNEEKVYRKEFLTNNGKEEVNLNLRIKKLKVKVGKFEEERLRRAQVR